MQTLEITDIYEDAIARVDEDVLKKVAMTNLDDDLGFATLEDGTKFYFSWEIARAELARRGVSYSSLDV